MRPLSFQALLLAPAQMLPPKETLSHPPALGEASIPKALSIYLNFPATVSLSH